MARKPTRRPGFHGWRAIAFCVLGRISVGLHDCRGDDVPHHPAPLQQNRSAVLERNQPYRETPGYQPTSTTTHVRLSVQYAESTLDRLRINHLSYNGCLVGPAICVRPGDMLEVRLDNNLPRGLSLLGHTVNQPHDLYSTNLHTHGLHVSPAGQSDNVFLQINPGEGLTYRFKIPSTHPAGTYWYHAHKHGSVAYQLANGMAGALIVRGGLDEQPEIREATERVMVFQQFRYRLLPGRPALVFYEDIYGDESASADSQAATAINGVITPTIVMRPGEVQRWRMIHAGIDATLNLNLEGHELHEIAVDGLATGTMTSSRVVELQPGYRSDVLVKASDRPGTYLLKTRVDDPSRAHRGRTVSERYVAVVQVAGDPRPMALPSPSALANYRPCRPIGDEEIVRRREVKLRAADGRYLIDGRTFDPDHVDQVIPLGSVEEWTITSEVDRHPIHIHVNPFEVITRDPGTGKITDRVWRDTIFVPSGKSVTFRSRFLDFTGKTVLHCHNLDHEDHGMMQAILIAPPGTPPDSARSSARGVPRTPTIPLPRTAPDWALRDASGQVHRRSDFRGKGLLLVLHRGLACPHCSEQIALLGRWEPRLREVGVQIVAVSADEVTPEAVREYRDRYRVLFPLLNDPMQEVFRSYLCLDRGETLHGTFLIDPAGMLRWQSIGESPEMDIRRIVDESRRLLAQRGMNSR